MSPMGGGGSRWWVWLVQFGLVVDIVHGLVVIADHVR